MSGQAEVDVSYRGLPVGAGLLMRDFGPTTAYVELMQPMPVGAELEVAAGGVRFPARVVHVREKIEGAEIGAMRIAVDEIGADARAWWDALVTTEDPVPPPEPEPAPEPAAAAAPEAEAAPAPEPVADDATDAIPQEVPEPEARRTLMMNAADLAEIQAMAQQQSAEEFAAREAEAAAVGVDAGADESSEEDDDDDDKKKKKRRRRNKKKR